jgi:Uma2 family endonuclease
MAALPQPFTRPLSVDEYVALGEDEYGRCELQGGSLIVSPGPSMRHARVVRRLAWQLEARLPLELEAFPGIDVDLQLEPSDGPGWVRRPDLVIATTAAYERVENEGGIARASEVLVVVEVVSPGAERIDHVIKHGEYADAGIPQYWIIDLDEPVSLIDCRLADGPCYLDADVVTGTFSTEIVDRTSGLRFPVRIELYQLFGR